METEKQIIYSIKNTLKNHNYNNDDDLPERLLRSHIINYRADAIRKHYKDGHVIEDQVFQRVKVSFKKTKFPQEYSGPIPKLIRTSNHFTLRLERLGITIPVLDSELFDLTKKNHINNKKVFSKTDTKNINVFIGKYKSCATSDSETQILINDILEDIQNQINDNIEEKNTVLDFEIYAVLFNPSDDPDYDWENDIFPFPAERLPELKMQILKNEFGIIVDLRAKKDEVSNARPDNIRYHEEQNVNE